MEGQTYGIHQTTCDQVPCPKCSAAIHFTTIHLQFIPQPFMYCQQCSSILHRRSDMKVMDNALAQASDITTGSLQFYEELERSAPPCPCGGRFSLWANVKCPTCGYEIPYNNGVHDPGVRVLDHMIVVIDGAIVVDDTPETSWQYRCTTGG